MYINKNKSKNKGDLQSNQQNSALGLLPGAFVLWKDLTEYR